MWNSSNVIIKWKMTIFELAMCTLLLYSVEVVIECYFTFHVEICVFTQLSLSLTVTYMTRTRDLSNSCLPFSFFTDSNDLIVCQQNPWPKSWRWSASLASRRWSATWKAPSRTALAITKTRCSFPRPLSCRAPGLTSPTTQTRTKRGNP